MNEKLLLINDTKVFAKLTLCMKRVLAINGVIFSGIFISMNNYCYFNGTTMPQDSQKMPVLSTL